MRLKIKAKNKEKENDNYHNYAERKEQRGNTSKKELKMNEIKFKIEFEDGIKFAKKSGDINKIHIDKEYCRKSLYGEPIVHGCNAQF